MRTLLVLGSNRAVWSASTPWGCVAQDLESTRKKVVGEPYEGGPHVRFEVAEDGDRDYGGCAKALSEETERNGLHHLSFGAIL